ncbi:ABC transporter permease [Kocuria palustris]|uniref:ABC transporter permease n=1 Tax=Kocuria palustris TaxID=71999 RepID=UPI00119EC6DC|nr:ABC transporter permease subunit [Kocuria palustris]
MNLLEQTWAWLSDPLQWSGDAGIPMRILEHLLYSGLTLLIALLIAVPLGAAVGHTGRGAGLVIGAAGALRALPTLGLLTLFSLLLGLGLVPPLLALVILAVPPILTAACAGVAEVPPQVKDAAYAQGMTSRQVLTGVEIPLAIPVLMGGIRNAALQVISTTTVAAYINLGGLGRYLIDGLAVRDYGRMLGSVLLVAVLAILVDLLLSLLQRRLTSPGIRALNGGTA